MNIKSMTTRYAKYMRLARFLFSQFVFVLLLASYFIIPVSAAPIPRVYLERVGNFGARVLIDSPEPVNAYDIRITFDESIVNIESIDTSRSIVTVLPSPMTAKGGEIIIKGGGTQPFSGSGGELITVQLKPVNSGVVQFEISNATAYRADGTGAPLALSTGSLPLRVTSASMLAYVEAKANGLTDSGDKKPPQITTIEIQANPLQYGERLVVFQAMDKETGIARYEARERSWLTWSAWRDAFNPYPLDSGAWAVQIKAIDYNNNFALATVYQLGNAIWKGAVSIILLVCLVFGIRALRKNRNHSAV